MGRTPKTWKGVERRIARYLDTVRNPLSGGNGKHTRSDSLHPTLYIEAKHGKYIPKTWAKKRTLFEDTRRKAVLEGKFPVVVLHPKGLNGVGQYPCIIEVAVAHVWSSRNGGPLLVEVPLETVRALIPTNPSHVDLAVGPEDDVNATGGASL